MAQTLTLSYAARITGRGLVLFTEAWSGSLCRGDRILLPDGAGGVRPERITAIEDVLKLDAQGQPVPCIGLVVSAVPDHEIDSLKALLAPGMTLTVEPLLGPVGSDADPESVAERMREALDAAAARAGKAYFDAPLPMDVDEEVVDLVARFAAFDAALRPPVYARLTKTHTDILMAFAHRMASLAVRERSVPRLRAALLAFALVSQAYDFDWRDGLLSFEPLEDAGRRLGRKAGAAFDEAARLAGDTISSLIRGGSPRRWLLLRLVRRIRFPWPPVVQSWKLMPSPDGLRYTPWPRFTEEDFLGRIVGEQLAYFARCLEAYRRDTGRYPTTEQGL